MVLNLIFKELFFRKKRQESRELRSQKGLLWKMKVTELKNGQDPDRPLILSFNKYLLSLYPRYWDTW